MADHLAAGVGPAGRADPVREARAVAARALVQARAPRPCAGRAACRARPRLSLLGDGHGRGAAVPTSEGVTAATGATKHRRRANLLELQTRSFAIRRIAAPLVAVGLGVGVVQRLAADRAEPGAVGRQSGCEGSARTSASLAQRSRFRSPRRRRGCGAPRRRRRLVDLARVDLERGRGVLEAADAGARSAPSRTAAGAHSPVLVRETSRLAASPARRAAR